MQDSLNSKDWFKFAERDLKSAKLLFEHGGPSINVGVMLQQAIEKYIKGYLLSKGWKLQKIHDIEVLIDEAIKYDKSFKDFLELGRTLSGVYLKSRYPIMGLQEYPTNQVSEWIKKSETLINKITKDSEQLM
jgi:HEPN domain-containing protein